MFGFTVINIRAAGIKKDELVFSHTVDDCLQRCASRHTPYTQLNAVNRLRVDIGDRLPILKSVQFCRLRCPEPASGSEEPIIVPLIEA